MKEIIKRFKHIFGTHEYEFVQEGNESIGGMLFGGAYHWSEYKCTICGDTKRSATESLSL